jgi:hypothetical protein
VYYLIDSLLFVLYTSLILESTEFRSKEWLLYFKRSYVERNNGVFSVSSCIFRIVSPYILRMRLSHEEVTSLLSTSHHIRTEDSDESISLMRHSELRPNKHHLLSPSGLHELCDAHECAAYDVYHSGGVREDSLQHDEGQGP